MRSDMDRTLIDLMYRGVVPIQEFDWDSMTTVPMLELLRASEIDEIGKMIMSPRYSGNNKLKTAYIDDVMHYRGLTKLAGGTNRIVYTHPHANNAVFKVAIDSIGIKDNPAEYFNQRFLKLFCTKVFECAPSGVIASFERVDRITTYEEFYSILDDIFYMLKNALQGIFVIDDIGIDYWMNYGIRRNFGPVLLDFPYLYRIDDKKLQCSSILENGLMCRGEIDYDAGMNRLVCTKCGRRYFARDIAKSPDNGGILISKKGDDRNMKFNIYYGDDIIKTVDTSRTMDHLDANSSAISRDGYRKSIGCGTSRRDRKDVSYTIKYGDKVVQTVRDVNNAAENRTRRELDELDSRYARAQKAPKDSIRGGSFVIKYGNKIVDTPSIGTKIYSTRLVPAHEETATPKEEFVITPPEKPVEKEPPVSQDEYLTGHVDSIAHQIAEESTEHKDSDISAESMAERIVTLDGSSGEDYRKLIDEAVKIIKQRSNGSDSAVEEESTPDTLHKYNVDSDDPKPVVGETTVYDIAGLYASEMKKIYKLVDSGSVVNTTPEEVLHKILSTSPIYSYNLDAFMEHADEIMRIGDDMIAAEEEAIAAKSTNTVAESEEPAVKVEAEQQTSDTDISDDQIAAAVYSSMDELKPSSMIDAISFGDDPEPEETEFDSVEVEDVSKPAEENIEKDGDDNGMSLSRSLPTIENSDAATIEVNDRERINDSATPIQHSENTSNNDEDELILSLQQSMHKKPSLSDLQDKKRPDDHEYSRDHIYSR